MVKWLSQKFMTEQQIKANAGMHLRAAPLEEQAPDYLDYLDRALCREGKVERFDRQADDWVEFKKVWY